MLIVNEAYTSKTVSWTGEINHKLGGRKTVNRRREDGPGPQRRTRDIPARFDTPSLRQHDLRHVQPTPVLGRVVELQPSGNPPGLLPAGNVSYSDAPATMSTVNQKGKGGGVWFAILGVEPPVDGGPGGVALLNQGLDGAPPRRGGCFRVLDLRFSRPCSGTPANPPGLCRIVQRWAK